MLRSYIRRWVSYTIHRYLVEHTMKKGTIYKGSVPRAADVTRYARKSVKGTETRGP